MEPVFGAYFAKMRRERLGVSLRAFAREHGYDAGNLSKLERGRLQPPQDRKKLEEYAAALGLEEGSDEWVEFFDRAAAARGAIPVDILEDDEIAEMLPILFRTLRAERVDDEGLDRIVDIVRKS